MHSETYVSNKCLNFYVFHIWMPPFFPFSGNRNKVSSVFRNCHRRRRIIALKIALPSSINPLLVFISIICMVSTSNFNVFFISFAILVVFKFFLGCCSRFSILRGWVSFRFLNVGVHGSFSRILLAFLSVNIWEFQSSKDYNWFCFKVKSGVQRFLFVCLRIADAVFDLIWFIFIFVNRCFYILRIAFHFFIFFPQFTLLSKLQA